MALDREHKRPKYEEDDGEWSEDWGREDLKSEEETDGKDPQTDVALAV